jgi:putative DNA primase/helicase
MIVTFFTDFAARAKTEEKLTLNAVAELVETTGAATKAALPWLKLARFGGIPNPRTKSGSLRWDGNVLKVTGVVADYDGEQMSPEDAADRLDKASIEALVYTSPSHSDAKPRWRVVCPLSDELPPDRHYGMVARLNGLLGGCLASESFTLSQAYYYGAIGGNPAHRVIPVEGTTTLDRCDWLDPRAIGKPNGGRAEPSANPEAAIGDIVAALGAIPNPIAHWDLKNGTWNEWNRIAMAVWRASGGSGEGRAAFHDWSRKWPEKYDADETDYKWHHLGTSPPDSIGFGTLVYEARQAQPGWRAPSAMRNQIRVSAGGRHEAADAGLAAMSDAGVPFYQRDQKLVRVACVPMKTRNGDTVEIPGIVQVTAPLLMRVLGQSAQWRKYNVRNRDWVPCDPPDPIAHQILSMSGEWPFPPIRGVISTQTMRPDGTLLTEPGYDAATGLVLFAPPKMPPIPTTPTKEDAFDALKLLDALFDEFPFTDDASRSVALSLDMSVVLRGAMTVVPLHVANAPEGGTGKSFLFDIAALNAYGEECPAICRGGTYEETEKRLIGAALEGRPLIVLDNVNGELRSEFLCLAIERPIIKPRPLGTTVMPNIPNSFVCGANGNNIEIADDLVRRTLQCSLDANMEQPYLREFKNDPRHCLLGDRGKYVAAVLTIARAYICAGRPEKPTPLASFEEWSDLVRGSLVWLDRADPFNTINMLAEADPVRDVMGEMFRVLETTFPYGFTVADVVKSSSENVELRNLVFKATRRKGDGDEINSEGLGWWLRRNKGRVASGLKLAPAPSGRKKGWQVLRVQTAPWPAF